MVIDVVLVDTVLVVVRVVVVVMVFGGGVIHSHADDASADARELKLARGFADCVVLLVVL